MNQSLKPTTTAKKFKLSQKEPDKTEYGMKERNEIKRQKNAWQKELNALECILNIHMKLRSNSTKGKKRQRT